MKFTNIVIAFFCLFTVTAFAQKPVPKPSAEVMEKRREKADYKEFRKQIQALKEFAEEKKKAPKIQKDGKEPVKIVATVDSTDDGDEAKTIKGYITQQIGDNTTNAYELIFDRATKKITSVKKTGDGIEPEVPEEKEKKPAAKPTAEKKKATPVKKKTDEDGDEEEADEDEPDEKPAKPTKKDKADD